MESTQSVRSPRSGLQILVSLTKRYPSSLGMILLLAFLASLVSAPTPYLGKIIIDDLIFRGGSSASHAVNSWFGISHSVWMIAAIVLLGVLLKVLGGLIGGWQCFYILRITRNVLYELRLDTASKLMGTRQQDIEKIESSRIASRLGFDVDKMDGAIFTILKGFVGSFFLVIVVLVFMLFLNIWLTLIVLVTMPVTAALTAWSYRKLQEFNRTESDRLASLTATTTEVFSAIRVIRTFAAEPFFLDRFRSRCEALRYDGFLHWSSFHAINILLVILSSLGGDIFLLVGGILAIQGKISFGSFFAFYGFQAMLWGPIGVLLNAGQTLQIGSASAEKVEELSLMPQEPYLSESEKPVPATFDGRIRAENLSFSYDGLEPVLRDVSFSIEPGSMVALVGQSGSGKTTLASLLLGLYLPTEGGLFVDDVDIRDWDLRDLRGQTGAVLQESAIFDASLRMNLCMGIEYPDDRIWAALAAAHIDDFVRSLPNQLDEPSGINGTRLSGGQKQRIAIARVFLKNPSFLVLDEATSALDSETEKAIQRSFDALMAGRTSVVIAHRLSTIFQADQILVLHHGKLIENGTHDELVQRSDGHYRRLYEAQVEGMIPMSGATRHLRRKSQS